MSTLLRVTTGQPFALPEELTCPMCGGRLYAEVREQDNQRIPTSAGTFVVCAVDRRHGFDAPRWQDVDRAAMRWVREHVRMLDGGADV